MTSRGTVHRADLHVAANLITQGIVGTERNYNTKAESEFGQSMATQDVIIVISLSLSQAPGPGAQAVL